MDRVRGGGEARREGLQCRVLSLHTLRPFDAEAVRRRGADAGRSSRSRSTAPRAAWARRAPRSWPRPASAVPLPEDGPAGRGDGRRLAGRDPRALRDQPSMDWRRPPGRCCSPRRTVPGRRWRERGEPRARRRPEHVGHEGRPARRSRPRPRQGRAAPPPDLSPAGLGRARRRGDLPQRRRVPRRARARGARGRPRRRLPEPHQPARDVRRLRPRDGEAAAQRGRLAVPARRPRVPRPRRGRPRRAGEGARPVSPSTATSPPPSSSGCSRTSRTSAPRSSRGRPSSARSTPTSSIASPADASSRRTTRTPAARCSSTSRGCAGTRGSASSSAARPRRCRRCGRARPVSARRTPRAPSRRSCRSAG